MSLLEIQNSMKRKLPGDMRRHDSAKLPTIREEEDEKSLANNYLNFKKIKNQKI